jgi:hypothetical protein
MTPSSQS